MIDHVQLKVKSFEKSRQFYARALEPLGYGVQYDDPAGKSAGFGTKGAIDLWIGEGDPVTRVHIAFRAHDRNAAARPLWRRCRRVTAPVRLYFPPTSRASSATSVAAA